jgi:Mrp family chromosome partitioning ATPase/LPS O-antigen subunit length determinant protein (WzzB/FepE family)
VDRLPVGWDDGPGLVASVWRYRWLVAAVALAGALAGLGFSLVQPVQYEASSRILLTVPSSQDGGQVDPNRFVLNEAAFMTSPPVLDRAVRLAKGRVTVRQLRERLVAEPSTESDLVTLRVRDATAQGAAELAEAVGRAYEETSLQQGVDGVARAVAGVQQTERALRGRLDELNRKLQAAPGDRTLRAQRDAVQALLDEAARREQELQVTGPPGDPVALRERPEVPDSPSQPKPSRLVALGGLLGSVLAGGSAWWLAGRRQAVPATPPPPWHDAAPLAAPLLGEIPDFTELAGEAQVPTATDPESPAGAAYRALASSLQSVLDRTGTRALVITSPEPGDGKTLTSVNLAVAMGESGQHVVLVDGDERHRGLSQLCDLDGQPGLTDLAGEATPIDYCLWLPAFTSIQVIPAGAPVADTAGFLSGPSFSRAMVQVRQHANVTVVDAPALLSSPDALAIAEQVEGVVLVVRPETSAVALIEARRHLDASRTRLLGYVLNRSGARRDGRSDGGLGGRNGPAGAVRQLPGPVVERDARARPAGGAGSEPAEEATEHAERVALPAPPVQ